MFKMSSSFESEIWQKLEKSQNKTKEVRKGLPIPDDNDIIEVTAKVVSKTIPNERIFQFDECVDYVSSKTKINGQLVAKGLVKAIDQNDFIAITNKSGVWLRKNEI